MLRYESAGRIGVSGIRKILAEIGTIDRRWWRGVLGFDAERRDRPVVLSGATPLFHPQDIPDEVDLFMAFSDAAFIVGRLSDWSKRFTIKWRLRMNGDDWGAIDASGLSPVLLGQMEKWARRAGVYSRRKGEWSIPEERRADLLRRYREGKGPPSVQQS